MLGTSFMMSQLNSIDSKGILDGLMASVIMCWPRIIVYRVLSDLPKFLGPKLTAVSSWYEAFLNLRSAAQYDRIRRSSPPAPAENGIQPSTRT